MPGEGERSQETRSGGRSVNAPVISRACLGWVQAANYACETDDAAGVVTLRSESGAPTRYYLRWRRDRLELSRVDDQSISDDKPQPVLFAANHDVMERYLVGLFGDDIREDVGLLALDLPWNASDVAAGCVIGDAAVGGHRTLSVAGTGPVAAAPDATLSLLDLVPLSHFLKWTISDLRRSFLNFHGAPLLQGGRYAPGPAAR